MKKGDVTRVAIIAGLILIIPLFGNTFIDGWNWSITDFIMAFIMIFGTGLIINFTARNLTNPTHRFIVITTIVLAFLVFWVELATDGVSRNVILLLS